MTALDERGEPVVVERIGPGRYLASGWCGGVGRYAAARTAEQALDCWAAVAFLPRVADRWAGALRLMADGDDVRGVCPSCQHEDRGQARPHAPDCAASDERPGERLAEEVE